MLKEKEIAVRKAAIFFDAFVVALAFFLAYFIRQNFHSIYKLNLFPSNLVVSNITVNLNDYVFLLLLAIPLWCLVLYVNGMYRSLRTKPYLEIVWIIIKSWIVVTLVFGFIVFILKFGFVSRLFFAIFMALSFFLILLEKTALNFTMHQVRKRGFNYRQILIVGKGKRAVEFIDRIKSHPEWGVRILGVLDDEPSNGPYEMRETGFIGTLQDLPLLLHEQAVDEVVFIVPRSRLNSIEKAVYVCETEGIKATIAADLFDLRIAKSRPNEIDGIPLITFETTSAEEGQLFIKRFIDLVISGLALILLSPVLLWVALSIKLSSPGPVLFKQKRLGLNGRRFILYKFRTMYREAQSELNGVDIFDEMDTDEFRKKKINCITPIGRILRKFSIDELPQFYNVLVGHMSLIGPRPTVPEEVCQYKPWQRRRLSMRPGLSCLWQVSGRNKISFEDWMKLDLEYIDNWSLWLDLKILLKTIPVVMLGTGAY